MTRKKCQPSCYEDRISHVRQFYFQEPAALNFCNEWQRTNRSGRQVRFTCDRMVKLPSGELTLSTCFHAEKKGHAVIGIGCIRKFEAFCNGILCCSTLNEGKLYDVFGPENHPFLIPVKKGMNNLTVSVRSPEVKGALFCCKVLKKEDLKLPAVPFAPVLTHPGKGTLCIVFRSIGAVGGGIEYRKEGEKEWQMIWDHRNGLIHRHSLHTIFLNDLVPGAVYEYRTVLIDPRDPDVRKKGTIQRLTAPPGEKEGRFSFFFTADPQFTPEIQRIFLKELLESSQANTCDFLVLGGDINSRYSNERIERDLLSVLQKYAGPEKSLVMLRGNHELRGPEPDAFVDFWSDREGSTYYMFRFGDTAFLVLDAWENRVADHPRSKYYSRHNLDDIFLQKEKEFVRKAVTSEPWQSARRRIVLAHGAPFSHYDSAATMYKWLQDMTDGFFAGNDPVSPVHLWLAGHTHIYTRSIPGSDDLAALAPPPPPGKSGKEYIFPVMTVCGPNRKGLPQLSCFRVDGFPDGSLTVRAFDDQGTLFEEIKICEDHSIEEKLSLKHFAPGEFQPK